MMGTLVIHEEDTVALVLHAQAIAESDGKRRTNSSTGGSAVVAVALADALHLVHHVRCRHKRSRNKRCYKS